ncbi:hypothetical protein AW736_26440 [Termitidicoccus mucosus]|uniref:Uncharacterized protein n=1 Tax=Termitidicoccus mucosus TaxID=1184151 RepID=A0A178IQ36_9BACT|nr:hypothetical protein AW736_26440 [Opitutaceae bacterium TSB47]
MNPDITIEIPPTFETVFEGNIRFWIYGVAFIVTLIGYYNHVWKNRSSPSAVLAGIGKISLCVLMSVSIPVWRPLVTNLFYWPANTLAAETDGFKISVVLNTLNKQQRQLDELLDSEKNEDGLIKKAYKFVTTGLDIGIGALKNMILLAMNSLLQLVINWVTIPFYYIQKALVPVMFSFMPIAICALTCDALKQKAVTYICWLLSVLAWPLGFTLVAGLVHTLLLGVGGLEATNMVKFMFLSNMAGIVFLIGTLMVPPTTFYIFTQGGTSFSPVNQAVSAIPYVGHAAR